MPLKSEKKLGELMVERGLLSQVELEVLLRPSQEGGESGLLGESMLSNELLEPEELEQVIHGHLREVTVEALRFFGEKLVAENVVPQAVLDETLEQFRQQTGKVDPIAFLQMLVDRGAIKPQLKGGLAPKVAALVQPYTASTRYGPAADTSLTDPAKFLRVAFQFALVTETQLFKVLLLVMAEPRTPIRDIARRVNLLSDEQIAEVDRVLADALPAPPPRPTGPPPVPVGVGENEPTFALPAQPAPGNPFATPVPGAGEGDVTMAQTDISPLGRPGLPGLPGAGEGDVTVAQTSISALKGPGDLFPSPGVGEAEVTIQQTDIAPLQPPGTPLPATEVPEMEVPDLEMPDMEVPDVAYTPQPEPTATDHGFTPANAPGAPQYLGTPGATSTPAPATPEFLGGTSIHQPAAPIHQPGPPLHQPGPSAPAPGPKIDRRTPTPGTRGSEIRRRPSDPGSQRRGGARSDARRPGAETNQTPIIVGGAVAAVAIIIGLALIFGGGGGEENPTTGETSGQTTTAKTTGTKAATTGSTTGSTEKSPAMLEAERTEICDKAESDVEEKIAAAAFADAQAVIATARERLAALGPVSDTWAERIEALELRISQQQNSRYNKLVTRFRDLCDEGKPDDAAKVLQQIRAVVPKHQADQIKFLEQQLQEARSQ